MKRKIYKRGGKVKRIVYAVSLISLLGLTSCQSKWDKAYDEGFEKGAYSVVEAVSELIGKDISIDFGKGQDNED